MSEFVPSRGRKQCPACGEPCGARLAKCKKCGHVYYLRASKEVRAPVVPELLEAVMQFVSACGGFANARVMLKQSELVFQKCLDFNQKYGENLVKK